MSLAEEMKNIADKVKRDKEVTEVEKIYPEILEDIKKKADEGLFALELTNYDKEKRYKKYVITKDLRNDLMKKLLNDGFKARYVTYNDYWNDGKEKIVIEW